MILARPILRKAFISLGLISLVLLGWMRWGPMPTLFRVPYSTVILDRNGDLMGASVAADGQWRMPPGDSIPYRFEHCLLTFEDRHFHGHYGIHLPSLARAFLQNRRAGRTVSGGSTITMQVARLGRPPGPRNWANKLAEMWLAVRLEMRYTKQEIMAMHASHAPFGGNVVGLEAAAWRWFGRAPAQLGWAECATLAVLPNAPSTIHPGKGRKALRAKRDRLLGQLMQEGIIDSLTWSLALNEPLPEAPRPLPRLAPQLLTTLQRQGRGGRRLTTTLHGPLQQRVLDIVQRHTSLLRANEVHNAALLVMDVPSGAVLAYVGNAPEAGTTHAGEVDIIRSRRSTGSLLKPFLYADMLRSGSLMPDQLVADIPTYFAGFVPRNFDDRHAGAVPASRALARSLNIPAVRALHSHGIDRTLRKLRAMGLHSLDRDAGHYGLTLMLGGAEATLWELTGAYASLSRIAQAHPVTEGVVHAPQLFPGEKGSTARSAPLSAAAAYHTLQALQLTDRPASDAGWQHFHGGGQIAWKTGTSFGHRDAWAIGVTDRYAVGVWTGNASGEGRPGLTGGLAAAPMLFETFAMLPAGEVIAPPYDALMKMAVCRRSGHRAGPDCELVDSTWTIATAERTPPCPYHRRIVVNAAGTHRTRPGPGAVSVSWFVLPPAMELYLSSGDALHRPLPPWELPDMDDGSLGLEILYPGPGARLLVPVDLDGRHSPVVLQAAHRDPGTTLHWDLDGNYLGSTSGDHRMAATLPEGAHQLTLTDRAGHSRNVRFTVDRGRSAHGP